MAQEFDFNSIEQPLLKVTMRDRKHTVLHLELPSEELIERFFDMATNAKELFKAKDKQTVDKIYDLMAEIFSNNQENISITGEELWKEYRVSITSMIPFTNGYLDFINSITKAKN